MVNLHFCFSRKDMVDFEVQNHTHKCFELVYYFSGKGFSVMDDKTFHYESNSFAIIPPFVQHNDSHLTNTTLLCIGFSCEDYKLPIGIFEDKKKQILKYIKMISSEIREKKQNFTAVIQSCLQCILIEISRTTSAPDISTVELNELKAILDYINDHYCEEISKTTLIQIANLSYDRIRHLFKHAVGTSIKQYILNKRFALAKKLLFSTQLPITQIVFECGFESTSLFSRQFKSRTSLTPSAYRQKFQSGTLTPGQQSKYTT